MKNRRRLTELKQRVSRRAFIAQLGAAGFGVAGASGITGCAHWTGGHGPRLENSVLGLEFDWKSGLLTKLKNKLTQETSQVRGDDFAVVAEKFTLSPQKMHLESLQNISGNVVQAAYAANGHRVVATYTLGTNRHFVEKQLAILSPTSYRLKTLVVSKLGLSTSGQTMVKYPYQKNVTYFGRTSKGGVFLGVELPFDGSSLDPDGTVTLGYQPSLKVMGKDELESEPIYMGVYARLPGETEQPDEPLPSESEAMVAMTSAIMGPPRHGLVAMACGWWCEMEQGTYYTEAQVEADQRSMDFLAECGIEYLSDSHPWSGETAMMNALKGGEHYQPGPLVKKVREYALKKNLKVVFWPTMNSTNPWSKYEKGKQSAGQPFRQDRPDWAMYAKPQTLSYKIPTGMTFSETVNGNCIANGPFYDWLMGLQFEGMRTGYFGAWGMDGDFFGGGGIVVPVNCPSDQHDHLPGDSNYGCERALNRMIAQVREAYPSIHIGLARPPMDLGIWSSRGADAIFTIDEFALPNPLPEMSGQPINVIMGDKLRKWSRVRVHQQFFPHYLDWPLVFAAPKSMKGPDWQSDKIDYVMLSAFSSSPNSLSYFPTKAGIPAQDKAEIRKWLEWGRKYIRYLQVRKDLRQGPEAGKVDGSAHIVDDHGLVFLFNPNGAALRGRFQLDRQSVGITRGTRFQIAQIYPASEVKQQLSAGEEVANEVPPHSAVVLEITPIASS
jgi:hypothetical protein